MPEGPEVRRQADRVRSAVGGAVAERVRFGLERLAGEGDRLSGRRVEGVESRGKALLLHFEGGVTVYTHSQLYGRWRVIRAGRLPSTRRQLRLAVEGPVRWALLYSASDIDVLATERLDAHPFLAGLGPDALDPEVTPDAVEARLASKRFRGRRLGGLLLDQAFVAGLGNYLRSEILFFAGLRPERRPADLAPSARAALARSVLDVTRRSYRTGGVTVEAPLGRRLEAEGLSKRARRHHVFGRAGATCRRCATPIEKREVAGRRLYLCPGCQV